LKAPARSGLSFERDLLDRASHFSEPEIDHYDAQTKKIEMRGYSP
jgi:hypothetical protein